MTGGVLNRYLMREGAASWLAVTGVLLAIMLSTRFIRFLSMAAAGVCVSAAGATAGGGAQRGGQERPEPASQAGFAHESREVGFATRF